MYPSEDVEQEMLSLEAIYGDEYTKIDSNSCSLRVFDVQANITLDLLVGYDEQYPESTPSLKLRVVSGSITLDQVMQLEQAASREACRLVGRPMVYDLVEWLKPELAHIQKYMDLGAFRTMPVEILQHVLSHLPRLELAKSQLVSKSWRSAGASDMVWKLAISNHFHEEEIEKVNHASPSISWREKFKALQKQALELHVPYPWIAEIRERVKTGDEWGDASRWEMRFCQEVLEDQQLVFDQGTIRTSYLHYMPHVTVGRYKFLSAAKVARYFSSADWLHTMNQLRHQCPYTGNAIGYVNFETKIDIWPAVLRAGRGPFANVRTSTVWPVIKQLPLNFKFTFLTKTKFASLEIHPERLNQEYFTMTDNLMDQCPYSNSIRNMLRTALKSKNNSITYWGICAIRPENLMVPDHLLNNP